MSSHSHHHICGGAAEFCGKRIYEVACLEGQVSLVAYFFQCRADSVPIYLGEIRQSMEVILTVNVVNMKRLQSILTESADKVAGVNADDGCVTDIETSHEPLAVKGIDVTDELLGAGAGGMVDLKSTRLLPHILNAHSHTVFLAIGLQRVIKLHIPFKKLLGNAFLAILKMLNGMNDDIGDTQVRRISYRSSYVVKTTNGFLHITKA